MKSLGHATWQHFLLILCTGLVVLVPGSAQLPLIDRDEPRFARAAVEMRASNTWLVPTFNGQYRFDKPPLVYALIRAAMSVFGENELGARAAVVVCTLAVAVMLYFLTREFSGPCGALLASLAWLTCLQVWIHGRLCLADMPMVLAVLAAQWSLWRHLSGNTPPSWKWTGLLYLSLAIGFAAKGPVALAVPVLTLMLWRLFSPGSRIPWAHLRLPAGLVFLLALTAAWGVPVLWETHGAFWKVGIGEHVVRRGFEPFNGRFPLPVYYLLTVWPSLLPWACLIPPMACYFWRRRDRRVAFLAAWLAAPVLIFSCYATQLPHYILPGLPAFFCLLGLWWEEAPEGGWRMGNFTRSYLAVGAILAAGFVVWAWPSDALFPGTGPALLGLACVLASLLLLPLFLFQRRWIGSMWAVFALGAGAQLFGSAMQPLLPARSLAGLWARFPGESSLVAVRYHEPSLVFYSGRRWQWWSQEEATQATAPEMPAMVLTQLTERNLITLREKSFMNGAAPPATGVTRTVLAGINPARFSWVELQLDTRGPDKSPSANTSPASGSAATGGASAHSKP